LVKVLPSVLRVGGVQLSVARPVALDAALTPIEKLASEADALPSLTLIAMLPYVPTCAEVGVPESLPVLVLNEAHEGLLVMLNVSVSPLASRAVGVKL
jgi:hypothetical protein